MGFCITLRLISESPRDMVKEIHNGGKHCNFKQSNSILLVCDQSDHKEGTDEFVTNSKLDQDSEWHFFINVLEQCWMFMFVYGFCIDLSE